MSKDVEVTRWTSADGKYKVVLETGGEHFSFMAFRHGQPWQNLVGENLILAMFQELTKAPKETADA